MSNRGKGCPISGIIPALTQRPLFLPIILATPNLDYLTKRGNFGEPWIAQDFPKISGKSWTIYQRWGAHISNSNLG